MYVVPTAKITFMPSSRKGILHRISGSVFGNRIYKGILYLIPCIMHIICIILIVSTLILTSTICILIEHRLGRSHFDIEEVAFRNLPSCGEGEITHVTNECNRALGKVVSIMNLRVRLRTTVGRIDCSAGYLLSDEWLVVFATAYVAVRSTRAPRVLFWQCLHIEFHERGIHCLPLLVIGIELVVGHIFARIVVELQDVLLARLGVQTTYWLHIDGVQLGAIRSCSLYPRILYDVELLTHGVEQTPIKFTILERLGTEVFCKGNGGGLHIVQVALDVIYSSRGLADISFGRAQLVVVAGVGNGYIVLQRRLVVYNVRRLGLEVVLGTAYPRDVALLLSSIVIGEGILLHALLYLLGISGSHQAVELTSLQILAQFAQIDIMATLATTFLQWDSVHFLGSAPFLCKHLL